jgi:hypothetical protein
VHSQAYITADWVVTVVVVVVAAAAASSSSSVLQYYVYGTRLSGPLRSSLDTKFSRNICFSECGGASDMSNGLKSKSSQVYFMTGGLPPFSSS